MTEGELRRMYRYVCGKLDFMGARVLSIAPALRLQLEQEWREKCLGSLPPVEGGPWAGDAGELPAAAGGGRRGR